MCPNILDLNYITESQLIVMTKTELLQVFIIVKENSIKFKFGTRIKNSLNLDPKEEIIQTKILGQFD